MNIGTKKKQSRLCRPKVITKIVAESGETRGSKSLTLRGSKFKKIKFISFEASKSEVSEKLGLSDSF